MGSLWLSVYYSKRQASVEEQLQHIILQCVIHFAEQLRVNLDTDARGDFVDVNQARLHALELDGAASPLEIFDVEAGVHQVP